ncbi:MAG: hypothetical protein KME28_20085 [Pelatocladus maniniholoensis HA4357-MV3]|jgi:hypothetical protein|uniref:Uncharacterized protein n=1 Tax=Pelatocladus maniniholoensis HA4357-MV3 TaxID=1117104 RepID=A0A9E3HAA6_9NOST|nr:hypothetical protein [Pelatocladus maniniholoensis HA4357-MV3]
MRETKPKKHLQPTQDFTHESKLFEDLTDGEIEKVCGGATKLDFEDFKVDFKFAKVEFTAEFLTFKI